MREPENLNGNGEGNERDRIVSMQRILLLLAESNLPWEVICSIRNILMEWSGLGDGGGGDDIWLNKKNAANAAALSVKTFGNAVKQWPVRTRMIGDRLHYHGGDIKRYVRSDEE